MEEHKYTQIDKMDNDRILAKTVLEKDFDKYELQLIIKQSNLEILYVEAFINSISSKNFELFLDDLIGRKINSEGFIPHVRTLLLKHSSCLQFEYMISDIIRFLKYEGLFIVSGLKC